MVEQLPVVVARVSRPYTGASLADAIDVLGGRVLWATARGPGFCGLATCFGAPTSTLGSEVTPPEVGSVCDIAVPLGPHMRPATKSDENLIVLSSPKCGTAVPGFHPGYKPIRDFRVTERYSVSWNGDPDMPSPKAAQQPSRVRDKARPVRRGRMQLISRAAAVLRALETQSGYASLGQIANASGLPRPTVQRIVDALAAEQFVSVDPQRGVRLGPELTRIARAAYVDLAAIVQPHIDNLARETGETAAVTVLRDHAAVYIAQAVPDRTIRNCTARLYCPCGLKILRRKN